MRTLKWLVLVVPVLLGGCHLRHTVRADTACGLGIPYDKAVSVGAVKAPDGLTAPNVHNVLKIPDIPAAAQTEASTRRSVHSCLDEPPKFIDDSKQPAAPRPAARPAPSND